MDDGKNAIIKIQKGRHRKHKKMTPEIGPSDRNRDHTQVTAS